MLWVVLSQAGYKILRASNAPKALSILREMKVDAVISDIGMPGMNGYQLAREVRLLPGYEFVPMVAVTGYSMFDDKQRSTNAGFNAHMTKPIDPNALLQLVTNFLDEPTSEPKHFRTSHVAQYTSSEPKKNENKKKSWRLFKGKGETDTTDWQPDKKPDAIYSVIAHDLKNEFSIIGTEARRIRALVDGDSEVVESCNRIDRSVAYSRQRLLLLLTYAGLSRPIFNSTQIVSLIDRIEWLIKPRLQSGVELSIKADPEVFNKTITTDIEQVTLVLQELVNNAADELFQTGGNVEISFEEKGSWLLISVKDSGHGVSKEIKNKLFTRRVRTKKPQGLGLGLFLSSRVVQSLGGKLNLEKSSEQGSTFTISLPIA